MMFWITFVWLRIFYILSKLIKYMVTLILYAKEFLWNLYVNSSEPRLRDSSTAAISVSPSSFKRLLIKVYTSGLFLDITRWNRLCYLSITLFVFACSSTVESYWFQIWVEYLGSVALHLPLLTIPLTYVALK